MLMNPKNLTNDNTFRVYAVLPVKVSANERPYEHLKFIIYFDSDGGLV